VLCANAKGEYYVKPMIKYRGGKSKEIPAFQRYIPASFDRYFEPFLGGGAVYFHLSPKNALINDINPSLMLFYQQVQQDYATVRMQLDELQELYEANHHEYMALKALYPDKRVENKNEDLYYELRDMYNGRTASRYLYAVLYFFINKTAYSGMIRHNTAGEYNVPFGLYQNFNTQLITQEHHELLKRSQLFTGDYSVLFEMAAENDFMFLDPPYDCVFHDYGNIPTQGSGFGEQDHRRLAADFRRLKCKGLMVIGRTALTEELYVGLIRGEYEKSYAVNIRNRFKSESKHIIVTNYPVG